MDFFLLVISGKTLLFYIVQKLSQVLRRKRNKLTHVLQREKFSSKWHFVRDQVAC